VTAFLFMMVLLSMVPALALVLVLEDASWRLRNKREE
jgi:hypothetical protein